METQGQDRLLTALELSARMRVARGTIYELVRRGELPYIRVGKQIRFLESEVFGALREDAEA